MTNYPAPIPIYDEIWNQPGLRRLRLLTHWFFWAYENGTYNFSKFDEAKLRASLKDESLFFPGEPIVLDQENPTFDSSTKGIKWHLKNVAIVKEERPSAHVAYYGQLPERSWYAPTDYRQMLSDKALGLRTWFTMNEKALAADYEAWKARCRLFDPVAKVVDSVHPSIYSIKPGRKAQPAWVPLKVEKNSWLSARGYRMTSSKSVQFAASGPLPKPLQPHATYHVLEARGFAFRVSQTAGGPPIEITGTVPDRLYVGDLGPYTSTALDPNTRAWGWYAEEMIQQARVYGKPVYAWLAPTEKGVGSEWLSPEFWCWQLEKVAPLVDGIVAFHSNGKPALVHKQAAWSKPLVEMARRMRG